MKKQINSTIKAHIIRRAPYLLLLVAGTVTAFFGPQASKISSRTLALPSASLSASDRRGLLASSDLAKENRSVPSPSLEAVMSQAELEQKVEG